MTTKLFYFVLIFISFNSISLCDDRPSWFEQDSKTKEGWNFYCSSTGKTEDEAYKSAKAQCSQKICFLFGVEVSSEVKTEETLKDSSVKNSIIEKCPNVRVVGRIEKRKSVECSDKECVSSVYHFYPISEFNTEFSRLNKPSMVKEFEKTIIIRENGKEFLDPKKCKIDLKSYSEVRSENEVSIQNRINFLDKALVDCKDLDYRDVNLKTELNSYIGSSIQTRKGPTLARAFSALIMKGNPIDQLLVNLKKLEENHRIGSKNKVVAEKLIKNNFDWLYYAKANKFVEESKTCQHHMNVLKNWPIYYYGEILTCYLPDSDAKEFCQTSDLTSIRFSYFNCICRLGSKDVTACMQSLEQLVQDQCPLFFDNECINFVKKFSAETMKLNNVR